jgi:hypothetical protein
MPDKEDFDALVAVVGTYDAMSAAWGFGGNAQPYGVISSPGDLLGLWSSTPNANNPATAHAMLAAWGSLFVADWGDKAVHGFQVRCVK